MRATEAYAELLRLERPVVTTGEVAARLRVPKYTASSVLRRLERDGIVMRIRRGLWALGRQLDPYALPECLTAPYPSYVSLWTALYHHGMIDQVPRDTYIASVDRSKRIRTPVGTYVIHHLHPDLFGGFSARGGVRMATPEKALFDTVYLALSRGRRFARLPEVELPSDFNDAEVRHWVAQIPARRLRTLVGRQVEKVLAEAEREEVAGGQEDSVGERHLSPRP